MAANVSASAETRIRRLDEPRRRDELSSSYEMSVSSVTASSDRRTRISGCASPSSFSAAIMKCVLDDDSLMST